MCLQTQGFAQTLKCHLWETQAVENCSSCARAGGLKLAFPVANPGGGARAVEALAPGTPTLELPALPGTSLLPRPASSLAKAMLSPRETA